MGISRTGTLVNSLQAVEADPSLGFQGMTPKALQKPVQDRVGDIWGFLQNLIPTAEHRYITRVPCGT